MNILGITWQGKPIDDAEILGELPPDLTRVLCTVNGFIIHNGAIHVRGASVGPEWHSLRAALHGPNAFHSLYKNVEITDIPFAQDQLGDQYLLRHNRVYKLSAEAGDIELLAESLDDFFKGVDQDIETYLNIGLGHSLEPGQLLMAFPPFVVRTSDRRVALRPISAGELILFHADLARQIQDVPDGGSIQFETED